MTWNFWNPVRIRFSAGATERLSEIEGDAIALVTTEGSVKRHTADRVAQSIGRNRVTMYPVVQTNPSIEGIEDAVGRLGDTKVDCIVALGGGSALDTGKVLRVLVARREQRAPLRDLLSREVSADATTRLPLVAVPTTAGSGSEVTPFATVWDVETKTKHSLAGPGVFPTLAVVDPELTLDLPREQTITSGLDALSQGLEAIWNRNATPITTALAARAVALAVEQLPVACATGSDPSARSGMSEASLLAGLAISQTRTALAHSISYPLTAQFGMPHGLACSFTLPAILRLNAPHIPALHEVCTLIGVSEPEELAVKIEHLLEALGVWDVVRRHLRDAEQAAALADEMFAPGRVENNAKSVNSADVQWVLRTSLQSLHSAGILSKS